MRSLRDLIDARQASLAGCRFLEQSVSEEAPLVTYAAIARRARAIGAHLVELGARGERAILLYPPGIDYIATFLGCVYAGVVAVPAYPPDPTRLERTLPRLTKIVEDAMAKFILTTGAIHQMNSFIEGQAPQIAGKHWVSTDVPLDERNSFSWPAIHSDDLAFLQYTSGSTGNPKGVMLTHANLLSNLEAIRQSFGLHPGGTGVIWLPPYHDMGLIGGILGALYADMGLVLMSPLTFLRRPSIWLEAITRFQATTSGGPNFAYDLCSRKVTDEEHSRLDLSSWSVAFTGAEPVRKATLDRFVSRFAVRGFQRKSFLPCYGLAEATLLVTGKEPSAELGTVTVVPQALQQMRVVEPRVPYTAQVLLRTTDGSISVNCLNLSRSGMLVASASSVSVGTDVYAEIEIEREEFSLRAEVVRVEIGTAGGFSVGLRFLLAPLVERQRYASVLDRLLENLAALEPRTARSLIGCGKPALNQRVVIVQPNTLIRAWNDQVGEIWVSGPCNASGYWGRQAETKGTLLAHLADTGEGPFLRTGDLGFIRNGEIFVTGRVKDLIIIRGSNHFPQDIELTVERVSSAVRPGCVAAFSVENAGNEELVIVCEVERRQAPGDRIAEAIRIDHEETRTTGTSTESDVKLIAQIRAAIAKSHDLAPYAVVLLTPGSIPKTSSGKIQRYACRAAFLANSLSVLSKDITIRESTRYSQQHIQDLTTEQSLDDRVQAVITRILGLVERLSGRRLPEDASGAALVDLGVDSLAAAEIASELESAFSTPVQFSSLFQRRSIHDFAKEIAENVGAITGFPPLEVTPSPELIPLSYQQQRLWFLQQLDPDSTAYNICSALEIRGLIQIDILERVMANMVQRHPSLRTTFSNDDGVPYQRVQSSIPVRLTLDDLSMETEQVRNEAIRRAQDVEISTPFDLENGPLFRWRILRIGPTEHVFLVSMHHIISDGWSMGVLMREVSMSYQAALEGRAPPLPELPIHYADYAIWQQKNVSAAVLEPQLEFWKKNLTDVQTLSLGPSRSYTRSPNRRARVIARTLKISVAEKLAELCSQEGVTPFVVYASVLATLLARMSGQHDVAIGTPVANRTPRGTAGIVGFFVNTVVIRADLAHDPTFVRLLQRMKTTVLAAFDHQLAPFEKVVEACTATRDLNRHPLFQVMLALQPGNDQSLRLGDAVISDILYTENSAKFDLSLTINQTIEGPRLQLAYDVGLFEPQFAERILEQYCAVLTRALEIRESAAMALADGVADVESFEQGRRTARLFQSVSQTFGVAARRWPEVIAFETPKGNISFGELERRANKLASLLRKRGVRAEDRVALLLDRRPEQLIAILAVWKVGGAYVPLDPSYPHERLRFLLQDSDSKLVLTQSDVPCPEGDGSEFLRLDELNHLDDESAELPRLDVVPEQAAYVLYTSGSTGTPKGVVINHGSLSRLAAALDEGPYANLSKNGMRVSVNAAFSFDGSVKQWVIGSRGHTLVSIPEEVRVDGRALVTFIRNHRLEVLDCVPTQLKAMMEEGLLEQETSLKLLLVGGEPIDQDTWLRLGKAPFRVCNLYGPTECTVDATAAVVTSRSNPTIGRPIDNVKCYVLDENLRRVPEEITGELYIGGGGVGRGYHCRPRLTAERFVPDPFAEAPGARMYRTGDLVRWTRNGELVFVARSDDQVKLRGFRIELGEVAAAVRNASKRPSEVLLRTDLPMGDGLVAYVLTDEELDWNGIRDRVRNQLPAHMTPQAFVAVRNWPLLPNGKLDRKRLPAPTTVTRSYVAPRNEFELGVVEVMSQLLGVEHVSADDDFFALGGHSLLATRLVSRLRERFGVDVPLRTVFDEPSVAGLADYLRGTARSSSAISPLPADAPKELSFAQERLWFLWKLEGPSATYSMTQALELTGAVDESALRKSFQLLVRRHESLRTTFPEVHGRPTTKIIGTYDPLEVVSESDGYDDEETLREFLVQLSSTPFNLEEGPLLRAWLLSLKNERSILMFSIHHIICDGWSLQVLARELSESYAALIAHREPTFPSLRIQLSDHAAWQRRLLDGTALESQKAQWREILAGAPGLLELPTDFPRPAAKTYRGATIRTRLEPELVKSLHELARDNNVTLYMLLLAAFQALLHRYSGQEDLLIGTPVAGRHHSETESLIGLLVNTVVLRSKVTDGQTRFRDFLAKTRTSVIHALTYQEFPFEKLVEAIAPTRSLAHTPIFQVMFAMQTSGDVGLRFPGVRAKAMPRLDENAKFDLTLFVTETSAGMELVWEYASDLFLPETVGRMSECFGAVLRSVEADSDLEINKIQLISNEEQRRLIFELNSTNVEFPFGEPLYGKLLKNAEQFPDSVAFTDGVRSVTFKALARKSDAVARMLVNGGCHRGDAVIVSMDRCLELPIVLLGILRAGAHYVPAEPDLPRDRLQKMIGLSGARTAVVDIKTRSLFEVFGRQFDRVICVSGDDFEVPPGDSSLFESSDIERGISLARPDDLAYIIFTSGSTGAPKGVAVQHRAVVNLFDWVNREFSISNRERLLFTTSIGFDLSVYDLFGAPSAGAQVRIASRAELDDPDQLVSVLLREQITFWDSAPAALRRLMPLIDQSSGATNGHKLRKVFLSGDWIPVNMPDSIRRAFPGAEVVSLGGATEATVWSNFYRIGTVESWWTSIPYGFPMQNSRYHVLDEHLMPCPVGVAGDLFIGGVCLAVGYMNEPRLTAERYIPDPWSRAPGQRLYRTGDRARYWSDGTLEFLGRVDQQVKIRGYRIELAEVEAALLNYDAIKDGCVVAAGDRSERNLRAYYVSATDAEIDDRELRKHYLKTLPEFMIPSTFTRISEIPTTPNGKLNRAALPDPFAARARNAEPEPRTPLEMELVDMWRETLATPNLGLDSDFFHVGGSSLVAVTLVARLRARYSVPVPVAALFRAATPRLMAQHLSSAYATVQRAGRVVVQLAGGGGGEPVFCLHPAGGDVVFYGTLADALREYAPVYGVQSAVLAGEQQESTTLDEMAQKYAVEIAKEVGPRPCRLVGWSMGGVLAVHVARLLEASGHRVESVALWDAHLPTAPRSRLDDPLAPFAMFLGASVFELDNGRQAALEQLRLDVAPLSLEDRFRVVLDTVRNLGIVGGQIDVSAMWQRVQLSATHQAMLESHVPSAASRIRAPIEVVWASASVEGGRTATDWSVFSETSTRVSVMPGDHFSIMRGAVHQKMVDALVELWGYKSFFSS
jgi:amino acid adenylation domain-containing protein